MTRCWSRSETAIAYSAQTVFPAEVCAETRTDSSRSMQLTAAFWNGSSSKAYSFAGFRPAASAGLTRLSMSSVGSSPGGIATSCLQVLPVGLPSLAWASSAPSPPPGALAPSAGAAAAALAEAAALAAWTAFDAAAAAAVAALACVSLSSARTWREPRAFFAAGSDGLAKPSKRSSTSSMLGRRLQSSP